MTTPWSFGVEPLPQTCDLAALMRRVSGLALALENDEPAVQRLIDDLTAAERSLSTEVAADLAPRIGPDPAPHRRVYLDHSRDIGAFNPAFPEYDIEVADHRASGSVSFPLAFEGPPGVVHGGVLATFFDCVIQHHNCDVGVAGKTTSLTVSYRRPTPLFERLDFTIEREADSRRITSHAQLSFGDDILCSAIMEAVAGDRARLPAVSPRRSSP
jgi:hypothetical protein